MIEANDAGKVFQQMDEGRRLTMAKLFATGTISHFYDETGYVGLIYIDKRSPWQKLWHRLTTGPAPSWPVICGAILLGCFVLGLAA